jgi:hypothetical protein
MGMGCPKSLPLGKFAQFGAGWKLAQFGKYVFGAGIVSSLSN